MLRTINRLKYSVNFYSTGPVCVCTVCVVQLQLTGDWAIGEFSNDPHADSLRTWWHAGAIFLAVYCWLWVKFVSGHVCSGLG